MLDSSSRSDDADFDEVPRTFRWLLLSTSSLRGLLATQLSELLYASIQEKVAFWQGRHLPRQVSDLPRNDAVAEPSVVVEGRPVEPSQAGPRICDVAANASHDHAL